MSQRDTTLWTMSGQATHDMTSSIMTGRVHDNTRTGHDMAGSTMTRRVHEA